MKITKTTLAKKTIQLALNNVTNKKGGPFAAIIVKNNKILSYSCNNVVSKNDPTAHAEIEAIRKACKKLKSFNLSGCQIYTSCKPCPMCLSAIYWANLKKVFFCADTKTASKYGFRDGFIFKELSLPENKRKVKYEPLNAADFEKPFKAWKKLSNKKKY